MALARRADAADRGIHPVHLELGTFAATSPIRADPRNQNVSLLDCVCNIVESKGAAKSIMARYFGTGDGNGSNIEPKNQLEETVEQLGFSASSLRFVRWAGQRGAARRSEGTARRRCRRPTGPFCSRYRRQSVFTV